MIYCANVFGWMTIIEANDKREALSVAKSRAGGASLFSTDVTASCIRQATEADLNQYRAMGGC